MFSNFIKTSVLAAALALGGTAVAGDTGNDTNGTNGNMQNRSQQQQQQGVNDQTQGQGSQAMQGQQGVTNQSQSLKSVRLSSLDQQQLKDVQTQLKDLGLYKGAVDGVMGNKTRGALQAFFQQQVSLLGQGRITDQALSGFGFAKSDIEKVRGIDESSGNVRQNTSGQDQQQQSPSINNQNRNLNQGTQGTQPVQPQQQNQPQQQQRQPY